MRICHLDAVEHRNAVGDRHEPQVAGAFGLESLLDLRALAPLGGEAFVRVNREFLLRGSREGQSGQNHSDQG